MVKSFDELISYLLEAIALYGHQGVSRFLTTIHAGPNSLSTLNSPNRIGLHPLFPMTKFS